VKNFCGKCGKLRNLFSGILMVEDTENNKEEIQRF